MGQHGGLWRRGDEGGFLSHGRLGLGLGLGSKHWSVHFLHSPATEGKTYAVVRVVSLVGDASVVDPVRDLEVEVLFNAVLMRLIYLPKPSCLPLPGRLGSVGLDMLLRVVEWRWCLTNDASDEPVAIG